MQSMSRRLIPAAVASLFGIIATLCWYYMTAPKVRMRINIDPIAYLESDPRNVQRKPSDNLIWENVKKGETLFPHDTVRASGVTGARIRMSDSESLIELEPESVIVLEEKQGKISLDLVNGGLFVKNENTKKNAGSGLEIKIGGTKLAAGSKGLEMNIRRDKGGKASVAVVKGQVIAESAGKSFELAQGKSGSLDSKGLETDKLIQVSQPAANAVVDIGAGDSPVNFRWTPLPEGNVVYLEVGQTPATLQRFKGSESPGQSGSLTAQVARGEHFWRLIAAKKDNPATIKASVVSKFTAIAIQPPELVSPTDKANLTLTASGKPLQAKLSWVPNSAYDSYEVKIAPNRDFRDAAVMTAGSDQEEVTSEVAMAGTFYWRVAGLSKLDHRRIESNLRSFSITKEEVKPPPSVPKLESPGDGVRLALNDAQAGVGLHWQSGKSGETYAVKVERMVNAAGSTEALPEVESARAEYSVKVPITGTYKWAVRSMNSAGTSAWSSSKIFVVTADKIALKDLTDPNADLLKPVAKLAWGKGGTGLSKWRIGFSEDQAFKKPTWHTVSGSSAELTLPKFGAYYVKLEGYAANDALIIESDLKAIKVAPPPKLPPPELILPTAGGGLVADANGDLIIKWKPVERAKGYVVILRDEKGVSVVKAKTTQPQIAPRRLMPGRYTFEIATLNIQSQVGQVRSFKEITVPAVSAVKPPDKIGKIQIK